MYNSSRVLEIIKKIESDSSRLAKEEILVRYIGDETLKKVLQHTYDPFITYGLTPPRQTGEGVGVFDADTTAIWAFLNSLATRAITGNDAFELTKETMQRLSPDSAELLWRIMSKDLRCGVTAKTINKLLPGTIPQFTCMLAHKFEEKRIKKWPAAIEPKLDGVRVICLVKGDKAQFFSRTGKPFPAVEHLGEKVVKMMAQAVVALMNDSGAEYAKTYWGMLEHDNKFAVALDGEIVSGSFNKTVGDVRRKSEAAEDAEYHIFDAMPYGAFTDDAVGDILLSYPSRRALARYLTDNANDPAIKLVPSTLVNSAEEAVAKYNEFRAQGLEGAIVKPRDGVYQKKRSYGWLKMKAEETGDFVIKGAYPGEPNTKYANSLGGLEVEGTFDGKPIKAKVGGGFSDVQRDEIWKAWLNDTKVMSEVPELAHVEMELVGRMIEVEFHEVTPDGSLRHPRFVRFRDDKHDPTVAKEAA